MAEQGKVKWFNEQKGYGFIEQSSGKPDLFVHKNDVDGVIKENDSVTFEVGSGKKGPIAVKCKKI